MGAQPWVGGLGVERGKVFLCPMVCLGTVWARPQTPDWEEPWRRVTVWGHICPSGALSLGKFRGCLAAIIKPFTP